MIPVDRDKVRAPSVLVGKNSRGIREVKKANDFYEKLRQQFQTPTTTNAPTRKKKQKGFKFKVYSDDEVKEVLSTLFGHKCAYCESRYASTQPMDVEHFRPKAGIEIEDDDHSGKCKNHFGYYWLAAKWENLLPSCIDCNRVREHEVTKFQGGAILGTEKLMLGKGNRFPISNPSQRALADGEEAHERPLLVNPCTDKPANYFEFTDDAVVRPKPSSQDEQRRASKSIEVYALNRSGLVQSRLEVLRLLQAHFSTVTHLAKALESTTDENLRQCIDDLIAHEMAEIKKFEKPDRPYSLMCLQKIAEFEKTFPSRSRNFP